MSDLVSYLRSEADKWTDHEGLRGQRPTRWERAQRLAQAADAVEGYNSMIEELQSLCDDFGCLGGYHRIKWLRSRLELLQKLEARAPLLAKDAT